MFRAPAGRFVCRALFYFIMTLLDLLSRPETWEAFYEYKADLAVPKSFLQDLRAFIDGKSYLPVCENIAAGGRFPLPKKSVVSKMSSQKKRTVYTYPFAENTVLKLLTWLLLRKYDTVFSDNLYSFRPGRTAKDAVLRLRYAPGVRGIYAYKADVSNYFNSIPVEPLLINLREILSEDFELYTFLESLLTEPYVLDHGKTVTEQKGIMAGTPLSAFYANVYLSDMDASFAERGILYARYSDDIIVFADSHEQTEAYAQEIRAALLTHGLSVNADKEERFTPDSGWVFLGFEYRGGEVDIAPASMIKLKNKMRRKTRALARWRKRNDLPNEKAAKAFIRVFNRKLFESAGDNELTWSLWYFPVITTSQRLGEIDRYAQDCIRYLLTDTRTKARYNARYEDLKAIGYRSLVHEYYVFREEKAHKNNKNNA